jgi:uncharacterized repeat protein (TIGR03803 family)
MPTLKPAQSLQTSRFWTMTALILLLWSCAVATPTFAQSFSVLYSFTGGADGANPSEGLVLDSAGNLYGTTQYGGTGNCTQYGLSGCGTVFRVTNQGTETVLYSFQGGSDGEYPWGGLALCNKNQLFGTTPNGGLGFGVVFSLDEGGTERIVHRFTAKTDGAYPYAGLTLDHAGHLYGTSTSGGDLHCGDVSKGCGTLFELHGSKGAVFHSFAGAPSDGNFPGYGAVLIDSSGNLFGTTGEGGTANYGTVYKVDRTGRYTVLYSFSGKSDGCEPLGRLAADEAGNLYGAASACGDFGKGTIFKVNSTGSFTLLHTFNGAAGDGNSPFGGVTRDRKGNLYGTTLFGGNCSPVEGGCGTVFKLGPNGSMTLLHIFDGYTDGMAPWGNVIQDAAGNLYGTTSNGGPGANGAGTVWKIAP